MSACGMQVGFKGKNGVWDEDLVVVTVARAAKSVFIPGFSFAAFFGSMLMCLVFFSIVTSPRDLLSLLSGEVLDCSWCCFSFAAI